MPFLHPTYILALLIALSVHEWAHAITATKLGDPTPEHEGRLTLSPLAHLDLMGAIMFLTVGFGWAKPVPVNPSYFLKPKRDMLLTAAAGPFSNLIIATVAFTGLVFLGDSMGPSAWGLLTTGGGGNVARMFLIQLCSFSLFVNLGLMAFNLLPIAPLDGSKVLEAFIPLRYSDQYEEFMRKGPYILLALFLGQWLLNIPFLSYWVVGIAEWVLRGMQAIAGVFL